MLGAINVLMLVLAARLLVLVSIVGAIGLAWSALSDPNLNRQIILGLYGFLVVIPCVVLASLGR